MKDLPLKLLLIAGSCGLVLGLFLAATVFQGGGDSAAGAAVGAQQQFTCAMHPQIRQNKPGKCPICAMDLTPVGATTANKGPVSPRRLEMSEEAKSLARIATVPVQRKFVEAEVRMVGKVAFDETRTKTISAYFPARIERLYVDYKGVEVRQDDHLAQVYSPELLAAQSELLSAIKFGSNIDSAREKLRLWGLSEERIRSIEKKGKPSDRMDIDSPLGGIVIEKFVNQGDYVKTGEPLFTIADLSTVWVTLDAYESDLPWLRFGQHVEFEAEAIPGQTFEGTVAFIAPMLDPKTRTVKVRVNAENPGQLLKPEIFVRAKVWATLAGEGKVIAPELAGKWISPMHPEIVRDEPGPCPICGMALVKAEDLGYTVPAGGEQPPLVVPSRSVLKTGKRAIVYVEVPNAEEPTYEGRVVELGPKANDYYIVEEGLSEGEQVVTEGNFKIDSELQILARSSMMSPHGADGHETQADVLTGPQFEAPPVFHELSETLYTEYLAAQTALAGDDLPKAKAAAEKLLEGLNKMTPSLVQGAASPAWIKFRAALQGGAQVIAEAKKIEAAREGFLPLSETLIEVTQAFGFNPGDNAVEAYCPMAFGNQGASWLQIGQEIRNPYFGAEMLQCGEIRTPLGEEVQRFTVAEPFHQAVGKLSQAYFGLQVALAGDDFDAAKAAVGKVASAFEAIDMKLLEGDAHLAWMSLADKFSSALEKVKSAEDIEKLRVAFEPLTMATTEIVKSFSPAGVEHVYEVHCPMAFDFKGASWLQDNEEVLNPYFGAEMLSCGSVKRKIGGPGKSATATHEH